MDANAAPKNTGQRYNQAMKTQRESSPVVWLIIIIVVAIVMTRVIRTPQWLMESAPSSGSERFLEPAALLIIAVALLVAAVATPIAGAYFIWWVVRRTNRRDDPRYAARPSTAADAGQIESLPRRLDQDAIGDTSRDETRITAILQPPYNRRFGRGPRRAIEITFGIMCLLAGLAGTMFDALQVSLDIQPLVAWDDIPRALTWLVAGCYLVFFAPREFKETWSTRLIWAFAFFVGVIVITTRLCLWLRLPRPDSMAFDILPWISAATGERIAELLARRRLRVNRPETTHDVTPDSN